MPKEELNPFKNTPESKKLKGELLIKILAKKCKKLFGGYSYTEQQLLKKATSKMVNF